MKVFAIRSSVCLGELFSNEFSNNMVALEEMRIEHGCIKQGCSP